MMRPLMLGLLLTLCQWASAQDAFVGARVLTGTGEVIEDGVVIVAGGRITHVGPRNRTEVAGGVTVHAVVGKVIIPGLVDTHSHIANTGDLNEGSGPLQPGLSAIDAIDPTHPSVRLAQAGGITTANIMPGSGNLMGGQTAYVKLRDATTIDQMLFCADRRTEVCGGMKMANGTNPQGEGAYPRTRMAAAFQQRGQLLEGKAHARGGDDGDKKKKKKKEQGPPSPDLAKDPLAEIVAGERTVHFHTHRADDIVTAMLMAEEYGFDIVLHHVSEAWKVAESIAEHQAPCSLIIVDSPGGKEEATEIQAENAAVLEGLGVPVALHTDDPITDSRLFLRMAALAIRAGMSEEGALAALTRVPAQMMRLSDRVGTLEVGKDADLVVLSGPPFSVWTHVEQTWVDGVKVFDHTDPEDRHLATGGWDAPDRYPELR